MTDTVNITKDAVAENFTAAFEAGAAADIRNFLFGYALGMERGAQLAKEPAPPAA